MARTPKTGLDYFSHDVNMASDRKIKLLKAKNGLVGYAVYIRLLEEAYRESGYYLECSDDFDLLFASDNNLDINVYINIINDCINYKLFDRDLYDKYKILTSKRMQKNFFDATTRRKKVEVYKEYLLLDFDKCDINSKNVDINSLNVDINSNNADSGTQRKVKKRREEEIRENINDDSIEKSDIPEEVQAVLNEFIQNRKQMKSPMTNLAIKKLVNNLKKLGNSKEEQIMILERSITNGWKGIFPLDEKDKQKLKKEIRKNKPEEIPAYMQEFVPEE